MKILSEGGIFREFKGIKVSIVKDIYEVHFDDWTFLRMSHNHKVMTTNGYVEARQLSKESVVISKDGVKNIIHIERSSDDEYVYDPVEVEDTHNYFVNDTLTHQCLMLDEFAFVGQNMAEEFFTSVYPTISSGKDSKLIIVSTPNGMNHFYKMWSEAESGLNGFETVFAPWQAVPWRDQKWADDQRSVLGDQKFSQEMDAEFIGASNTLISGSKIKSIPYIKPIKSTPVTNVYEEPEENHTYCITVDTSRGTGGDYSAFLVIDITTLPYKVVCTYRSNTISSMVYPSIVQKMAKTYNDASILVETNDIGESVAQCLYFEMENENVVWSNSSGEISMWGGKNDHPGLRTTTKTKRVGCDILKQLIEQDKLVVNDYDILVELSNFVVKGRSYEADVGNDDLVMCLVLFAYLTSSIKFEEMTNHSARSQIISDRREFEEQNMLPTGFFNDGTEVQEQIVHNF